MNNDLISREKLKKHYAWWRETENGRKMADIFDEIVDAQPPAEVPDRKVGKWVPVTERLPEENKPVLVTHHGKYQAFVSVDWIDPYTHEWNRTCNVTAWMPLPKPYKEDE